MRTVLTVVLCLTGTAASAGQPLLKPLEMSAVGGFSDGPGYASRAPGAGVSATAGLPWVRMGGGFDYSLLHKQSTPGGFQRSHHYFAEIGMRNMFLLAGESCSHTDQTDYIKKVDYRFAGAGYRWAHGWNGDRPRSMSEVRALYYREHRSTYANRTEMFAASYRWDRQVRGALYVRLSLRLGAMYFDEHPYPGAMRRNGLASSINIGLVGRP